MWKQRITHNLHGSPAGPNDTERCGRSGDCETDKMSHRTVLDTVSEIRRCVTDFSPVAQWTYLEVGCVPADLIDVWQGASVVRALRSSQSHLLSLNLKRPEKKTTIGSKKQTLDTSNKQTLFRYCWYRRLLLFISLETASPYQVICFSLLNNLFFFCYY